MWVLGTTWITVDTCSFVWVAEPTQKFSITFPLKHVSIVRIDYYKQQEVPLTQNYVSREHLAREKGQLLLLE